MRELYEQGKKHWLCWNSHVADRSAQDCPEVHSRTFPEAANQSGQHQRTHGSMGVQLESLQHMAHAWHVVVAICT
jgi:hypothetical protein